MKTIELWNGVKIYADLEKMIATVDGTRTRIQFINGRYFIRIKKMGLVNLPTGGVQ